MSTLKNACPKPKRRAPKPKEQLPRMSAKKRKQLGGKVFSTITSERKPVAKRNRARRTREFARCYGSSERVEFVKAQPSIVSGERPCVNAHVRNGGMGRKADAKWIVPMTDQEHRELHGWGIVVFETLYMLDLDVEAAKTEAAWQVYRGTR